MHKNRFGLCGPRQRRVLLLLLLVVQIVVIASWLGFLTVPPVSSNGIAEWWARKLIPEQQLEHEVHMSKLAPLYMMLPSIAHRNELSVSLHYKNLEAPRNQDLFPQLAKDHVKIVLYVHNRPQYLRLVVQALSKVQGINETLLIVSHDGNFEEMNAVVMGIRFCQVKQIFAVYSPHLFADTFPGTSPDDCVGKNYPPVPGCKGNPDQYGNHRSPKIVSLKHHWWWMMQTVWDGLAETKGDDSHILFMEEDHYLLPNAYRTIQKLIALKATKCHRCTAASLAPLDVRSGGEKQPMLVVEKTGNMGYAFNRSVWNMLHASTEDFCTFDDYNWDITLWSVIYPRWRNGGYMMRASRTSAVHVGKCGLHQGQQKGLKCADNFLKLPAVEKEDEVPFADERWKVVFREGNGYKEGHPGWGGWGDKRDHKLCKEFSAMYGKQIHGSP